LKDRMNAATWLADRGFGKPAIDTWTSAPTDAMKQSEAGLTRLELLCRLIPWSTYA